MRTIICGAGIAGPAAAADSSLPADPRAAIRAPYRGLGWVVPEALELCPSPEEIYYDQVAQIVMPTWSKGRVVLLGDAAYAVSLLAGQGASLGIAGAYILADCLRRSATIEAALVEYEQLWRPEVESRQRVGRSAARWFLPASNLQLIGGRIALHLLRLPLLNQLAPTAVTGNPSPSSRPSSPAAARRGAWKPGCRSC